MNRANIPPIRWRFPLSDKFNEWWNSNASPRRHMNDSTAEQVKWVARDAFTAGNHERHLRREKRNTAPANFQLGE